jgi:hypothetical protein
MRVVIRSSTAALRETSLSLLAGVLLSVAFALSVPLVHRIYSQLKPVHASALPQPNAGLEMRVQMQGDGILLSWNRDMPFVRSARRGVLQINDGSQEHRTELEPDQLTNGSILYNPSMSDVDFRLTVYGADGSTISDHLPVLHRSKPK